MTTLKELKARSFKNPKIKATYDRLEDEYALAGALIGARAKAKLTENQLARRMGTTRSAIARLESGRTVPSGTTLIKFAKAVGRVLRVDFR
jgi:DNA-binding XRE family transcriptional regulator